MLYYGLYHVYSLTYSDHILTNDALLSLSFPWMVCAYQKHLKYYGNMLKYSHVKLKFVNR